MSDFGWIPAEVELLIWHFKVRREAKMITMTNEEYAKIKDMADYQVPHSLNGTAEVMWCLDLTARNAMWRLMRATHFALNADSA